MIPSIKNFFGNNASFGKNWKVIGSGVIVGVNRFIIANLNALEKVEEETKLKIVLDDKREFGVVVKLKDKRTDLAILEIKSDISKLPYLNIAKSNQVTVGDSVFAIVNYGHFSLVTNGILSAKLAVQTKTSDFTYLLAHTAVIESEFSGGALLDTMGNLVGILTTHVKNGINGIYYAVPSRILNIVVRSAMTGKRVNWPWLGAELQTVPRDMAETLGLENAKGALIVNVYPNSPAETAGIMLGDVILTLRGQVIVDPEKFSLDLLLSGLDGTVPVTVFRNGKTLSMELPLQPPQEQTARESHLLIGKHPFSGALIANLSTALAVELSLKKHNGVVILQVDAKSIAKRYRLKPKDIVEEINGVAVNSVKTMRELLNKQHNEWNFIIQRKGRRLRQVTR